MNLVQQIVRYAQFSRDYVRFTQQSAASTGLTVTWSDRFPCLADNQATHEYDRHYILHVAWAIRVLKEMQPAQHVDIGSTLAFATVLSAYVPTEYCDLRALRIDLPQLSTRIGDLTALPYADGSLNSVSCMHVLEHVGLGRYGDRLDAAGDAQAIAELQRVVAPGGHLLLVVPVGIPKVRFNAHRIYSSTALVQRFAQMRLVEFAYIPTDPSRGDIIQGARPEDTANEPYACACFIFAKPAA
jgi:SAM-dependent methyltransferase